ncbi:unnamed protein product, partial [Polarella glacialis]
AAPSYNMYSRTMPPGWMDWQRGPAGSTTFEQDRPSTARWLQNIHGSPSVWDGRFAGTTLQDSFGRNDSFTQNQFFLSGRQSHGNDLRRITRGSPNRVTRVN